MWVRPETPAATRFGSPAMSGAPLCFDADSVEANRATQNAFCKARGFDVAQAAGTYASGQSSGCVKFVNGQWASSTADAKIVNVECISFPGNQVKKAL